MLAADYCMGPGGPNPVGSRQVAWPEEGIIPPRYQTLSLHLSLSLSLSTRWWSKERGWNYGDQLKRWKIVWENPQSSASEQRRIGSCGKKGGCSGSAQELSSQPPPADKAMCPHCRSPPPPPHTSSSGPPTVAAGPLLPSRIILARK